MRMQTDTRADQEGAGACQRVGGVEMISCDEAGYDGFWLQRQLSAHGIHSLPVDRRADESRQIGLTLSGWCARCWRICAASRRCGVWCGCPALPKRMRGGCTAKGAFRSSILIIRSYSVISRRCAISQLTGNSTSPLMRTLTMTGPSSTASALSISPKSSGRLTRKPFAPKPMANFSKSG
jgi:hypothetical protein